MLDIKKLAAFMSSKEIFSWVNSAENDIEKKRRIEAAKQKFLAQSQFASFAFAAVEDVGSPDAPDGIYDDSWLAPEKAETALNDIKRHIIREDIKSSTGDFVRRQNAVRIRNRQRIAEQQKAFSNR